MRAAAGEVGGVPARSPGGAAAAGRAGGGGGPGLGDPRRHKEARPRQFFETTELVDLGRGPGSDEEGGSARQRARGRREAGGGERGARGRPQTSPASSGKRAGGGGGGMGGPAPPGCDPADPPLGAPPPQPGARAGGA